MYKLQNTMKETLTEDRWQVLDIIKTLGLLGALFGHVFIWWFGENWGTTEYAFFSLDLAHSQSIIIYLLMIIIHFILISAGASFYFYLKKYKPTFKKIFFRLSALVLFGVLFGLNLHPPILFWNVFLFYVLSLLVIFILNRYGDEKTILVLTIFTLIFTPLLRLFLNKIIQENYLSAILIGNQEYVVSFYPFFPWFSLVGAGFLTSYLYLKYRSRSHLIYGLFSGMIISICVIPFLKPLDFSNIFGATSQIPINYIIIIFGLFIFLLSLLELIFRKITLSKYNPAIIIGRNILPVYLITIAITLPVTDALKNSITYGNSTHIFLILELVTFLIAYVSGAVLTYLSSSKLGFTKQIEL